MDKEKKIIYALLTFAVIASIAMYAFFGVRNPFAIQDDNTQVAENESNEELEPETSLPNTNMAEVIREAQEESEMPDDGEENTENNVQLPADEAEKKQEDDTEATKDPYQILPAYEPVERNSNELTIGFITDLHTISRKLNDNSIGLRDVFTNRINYFVEKMNNETVPDFMLINGDIAEGTRDRTALVIKKMQLIKKLFDRTAIQKYWVPGNHDLRAITKKQWKAILGINYLKKSFDLKDYKIIILDSNFNADDTDAAPGNGYTRGKVSAEEIKWLKKELKDTDKKTIVFIHHPPFWDVDFRPNDGLIENAQELRSIFSEYGVLAVFGGHLEELYHEKVDDVNYFVLPGIYKSPKYLGAFSIINIKDDEIKVELNYLGNGSKYKTVKIK